MPGSNIKVHRIRLRGPWQLQAIVAEAPPPRKVRLPAPWTELLEAGDRRVRLSRVFHRPTNLGPTDRILLAIDDLPEGAAVSLNGVALQPELAGSPTQTAFPTPDLEPNNFLTVEFDVAAITAAREQNWGDVALLISTP
jgi:hypothetical protein